MTHVNVETLHDKLQSTLGCVRTHSQVYDWLFTDPDRQFHPGAHTLTPSTFANSITINLSHSETHDFDSTTWNSDRAEPAILDETNAIVHLTPATTTMRSSHYGGGANDSNNFNDYVLGYVYAAGNTKDITKHPFGALPGLPGIDGARATFHGRFIYGIDNGHLLFTLSALGESGQAGIVSFRRLDERRRDRCFFSLATLNQTYDDCLPHVTSSKQYNIIHQLSSNLLGGVSTTEFRVDCSQSFAPTKSNGTDMRAHVEELNKEICGSFYAPKIVLDVTVGGELQHRQISRMATGQLQSQLGVAHSELCAAYREIVTQGYYEAGLSLVSENLVAPAVVDFSGRGSNNSCASAANMEHATSVTVAETVVNSDVVKADHSFANEVVGELFDVLDFTPTEINNYITIDDEVEPVFGEQLASLMADTASPSSLTTLRSAAAVRPEPQETVTAVRKTVGVEKRLVPLLPMPVVRSTAVETVEEREEKNRMTKIEGRRRQNRESSARRNEKVKAEEERRKRDIEKLKWREKELREREQFLQAENAVMRVKVMMQSGGGVDTG